MLSRIPGFLYNLIFTELIEDNYKATDHISVLSPLDFLFKIHFFGLPQLGSHSNSLCESFNGHSLFRLMHLKVDIN